MFQSITPPMHSSSFRLRLKTAFSPRSNYASSGSSTATTSPLSRRDSEEFSPGSFFSACSSDRRVSTFSPPPPATSLRALLVRHHKPSVTDLQLQEERRDCAAELRLLEPRPQEMFVMGGIFDVLEGKA